MRTSIWLVRHGQTELNKARRYQGAADTLLTPFGTRQAAALAQRLRRTPFKLAITSPAMCARATAAAILGDRKAPLLDDVRWAEMSYGRWEGLTYAEVCARFPQEAATRFADALNGRPSGGESLAEVAMRVADGWAALLQQNPGGRVLLVTHATPIQLVLCAQSGLSPALHWRWRIDLGSVTAIDVYGSGSIIRMVNEVPRL
jgi:2,3-bisphosphoglycerate-dependent phosphoglycerate mutase/probable phosphoglycerate mutase